MAKSPKMGRPKTHKITITVRVLPETKKRLERAAVQDKEARSASGYIEIALLAKLKKDGY